MKTPSIFIAILSAIPLSLFAADYSSQNIVIENDETVYKFIPDKQGTGLARIEESKECNLRADSYAEEAAVFVGYNDFLKLDKVSGGKQSYGSVFGKDIFYSDSKGCLIELPLKKAGDKASVKYKRTWLRPEFCSRVILYEHYPIEKSTVRFEIPQQLAGRYSFEIENCRGVTAIVTDTLIKDTRQVIFRFVNIPGYEDFDDAPNANITSPKIKIRGHFKDVNSLYRYLYSYLPTDDPGAATVSAKAAELTSGMTTDMEKASAIYDYVHSAIRYIAVENGELGHRPDLPSEVLKKLYGDCKGSAILLRDMLRSVGIDSRLVWIGVQNITDKWSENPNLSSGNHMIAAAFIGDSIVYLDGTAKYNTINIPPHAISGREVIIEDTPDECLLRTVPETTPSNHARKQRLFFTIDGKDLKTTGEQTLTGLYNTSLHYADMKKAASLKPGFYQKIFGACMANTRDEKAECFLSADSAVIKGSATAVGCVSHIGNKTYVDLNDAYSIRDLRFATKNRHTGGEITAPLQQTYHSVLTLPEGYSIAAIPADFSISNRWIDASLKYTPAPDGNSISREVIITHKEKFVDRSEMDSFNTDIAAFNRACSSKITLNSNH